MRSSNGELASDDVGRGMECREMHWQASGAGTVARPHDFEQCDFESRDFESRDSRTVALRAVAREHGRAVTRKASNRQSTATMEERYQTASERNLTRRFETEQTSIASRQHTLASADTCCRRHSAPMSLRHGAAICCGALGSAAPRLRCPGVWRPRLGAHAPGTSWTGTSWTRVSAWDIDSGRQLRTATSIPRREVIDSAR
jgi:hypothetical protein